MEEIVEQQQIIEEKKEEMVMNIIKDVPNPQEFPWPFEDGSVKEISCLGVLEYIPGKLRGKFMDEIYRVLSTGGKATIIVPYWASAMGIQDYRYEWPPFSEQSFLFFNKEWREANKLELGLSCDFHFDYGYTADGEVSSRIAESRDFFIKRYINSITALHIMLTKK